MSPNQDAQNYRPPTISELAERGKQNLWDPSRPLKHWLRTAEAHKRAAQSAEDNRDLENAFLEYAKAATIVVDKIPSHSEYHTVLNPLQRKNLGLVSYCLLYVFQSLRAFTLLFWIAFSSRRVTLADVSLFLLDLSLYRACTFTPCTFMVKGVAHRLYLQRDPCQRLGTLSWRLLKLSYTPLRGRSLKILFTAH